MEGKREKKWFFTFPFDLFPFPYVVTVKWRGKSAPAAWRHAGLVNPIGSKA